MMTVDASQLSLQETPFNDLVEEKWTSERAI